MQVLNLIREFKLQRMKESNTIKEYSYILFVIVSKVRLLGTTFTNSITSLKNTKNLSKITFIEILNALQAQKQQRLMRHDHFAKGALSAKHQDSKRDKKKFFMKNQALGNKITTNQF
jgi:hypothetical protein